MKLSISNIAWDLAEDNQVGEILQKLKFMGVELAPTKIWPHPLTSTAEEVQLYRNFWNTRNIQIVAFQSLLFGQPQLQIFQSSEIRAEMLDYLGGIMKLAAQLGAQVLVFGSPKNRLAGHLSAIEVMDIAVEFFSQAGEQACRYGVKFCIEPNPASYGCDFIRTAKEGRELVERVNHPNFRLHLDAGAMTLNEEPYEKVIEDCFEWTEHFHISEPYLASVGQTTPHTKIAQTLRQLDYDKWVSIEMLNKSMEPNIDGVRRAVEYVAQTY